MRSIADEVEVLRAMDRPSLHARYVEVFGKEPRVKHKSYLWRRIAWKLKERELGGLSSKAKEVLERLLAEIRLPEREPIRTASGKLRAPAEKDAPAVGTTYVRRWRDHDLRFTIVEAGVEVDGVIHKSLSAAIQSTTGGHWNPSVFLFGRRKAKESS
jgi:hypothetical protein